MSTRIGLVCVIVLLSVLVGTPTQAQESDDLLSVRFSSHPVGASVFLDNTFIGTTGPTPFEFLTAPGVYTLKYRMPGFADWENEIVVYAQTSFHAALQSTGELTQIRDGSRVEWDNRANRLRIYYPVYYVGQSQLESAQYDIAAETIETNPLPFYWLQDTAMRQALGITNLEPGSISEVAYESPSGRYIVYVPPHDPLTVAIYDQNLDITIPTEVAIPPYNHSLTLPEYRLRWSPNEQHIYVERQTVTADCWFVSLESTRATTKCVTGVVDSNGDPHWGNWFLGNPNDNGQILAILYDNDVHYDLWLINLADESGQPLGFEQVFDAVFSQDDPHIVYIANQTGLIRYNSVSGEQTLIESLLNELPVENVSLAPTLNYALIQIGPLEVDTYWIYQLPPLD